jgi:Ankyrin repeat
VLISAAAGGHASVAKLLLSRKAEVDAVNNVKSCLVLICARKLHYCCGVVSQDFLHGSVSLTLPDTTDYHSSVCDSA